MGVSVYDAKQWSVVAKSSQGTHYVTGFDEDMFTWEKSEANGEYVYGACGDAMYNKTHNGLHTLSMNLQPTSPSNAYFIALNNSDEEFSIYAINKALGLRIGGENARVTEAPSIEGAATGNPMSYTIQVPQGATENI